MIILKIDVTLKSSLHVIFQLLSELNSFLKLSFLLNNSISWQSLLFDQIKASGKYKQIIKIRITIGFYLIKIIKMIFSFRIHFKLCL